MEHARLVPNRLVKEKSPYLLQHAYNPVDWYPWGEEALERAGKEGRLIFLSIGYSACHWCHVMERESFEDPGVGKFLSQNFVCIKVDREERPDIDAVYMAYCQATTGSGGWPLNLFLTPDRKPFFAGTYLPRDSRAGRTGLLDLARQVAERWQHQPREFLTMSEKAAGHLQLLHGRPGGEDLPVEETLDRGYRLLKQQFDREHGGFGSSPKFPVPHNLNFLLRYGNRELKGGEGALAMVEKTLEALGQGGIYDHLGFGFHRYSTDRQWLLPHFEKMLYDQSLLALAYLEGYQVTGKEAYARQAREIFTYVLRDMTSPEGGFYSAEDADSEGVEGKFYTWETGELQGVLEEGEYRLARQVYNLKDGGNFRDEATGEKVGANIFHRTRSLDQLAQDLDLDKGTLEKQLAEIRAKLFQHREKRVRPHRDDKILTDWNGLMIAALARGARVLGEETYTRAACRAAAFLLENLVDPRGHLLKSYREGPSSLGGLACDYAYVTWGLIELYQATFQVKYLSRALELNQVFLDYFWDREQGGFFLSPRDRDELPSRPREIYDGALPSSNSVAAQNLLSLARLTGNRGLEEYYDRLGRAFSPEISRYPGAFTRFLCALEMAAAPGPEIVLAVPGGKAGPGTSKGAGPDPGAKEMLGLINTLFLPGAVVILKDESDPAQVRALEGLAPFTREQKSIGGKATAYVCFNYACQAPVTSPGELLKTLGHPGAPGP